MAEQFYTILTNTGKAKISNSILTGTKVNLTTLKVGDSNGAYYNPAETQTNLVHSVYQCNVTSVQVDTNNPNWITITSVIPSDQGGFFIREAGVFDDGGNLIAVGKYPETYKPQASDGSVKELYIKMTLEVSNATTVELKIDPTVILATKNDVNILTNTVNSIKSEIETARGGEANLDARLDKVDSSLSEKANQSSLDITNATVANKVDKVTGKGLSTNDYDNTEKAKVALIANKADITYVDTKVGSIGNTKIFKGSIVFANLPTTGNTNGDYYYVTDKTTNYCWNGSEWIDIGNNFSFGDNTVNGNKLSSDMVTIVNLFDKNNVVSGKYINSSDGVEKPNANFCYYKYPVKGSTMYSSNSLSSSGQQYVFFDSNNVYISGAVAFGTSQSITTPSNAAYMAFSITIAEKETFMIVEGLLPDIYYPHNVIKQVAPESINIQQLKSDIKKRVSLFDKTLVTNGYYVNSSTGVAIANSNYGYYKMSVSGNTKYIANASNLNSDQWAFYDSNNVYISGGIANVNPQTIITPSNASYCTFSILKTQTNSFYFVKQVKNYNYNPNDYVIKKEFLELPDILNKQGVIVVAKSGGDYTTIMDAINNANDSISNPITIVVYPGTYKEYLNIHGQRYISIIGINKQTCIIRYDDANYDHAPLRISGGCTIKNLTIISTANEYISTFGTGTGSTAWKTDVLAGKRYPNWLDTVGAYAVHCDDEPIDDGIMKYSRFENCYMYSETFPAFGSGMQKNQMIELIKCKIETKFDADVYAMNKGQTQGPLLCHGKYSSVAGGKDNQGISVKGCVIKTNIGRCITHYPENATDLAEINYWHNILISNNLNGMDYVDMRFNVGVSSSSFGNNISTLNHV